MHGYNGRETLTSRVYADWGGMPDNARRAMTEYIKGAEWKKADYIRPQYFIQVDRSFWVICMTTTATSAGIVPFRNGKDARKISVNNHFNMLVNTTDKAPALGYAILKNLAYADGLRVSTRKADGLTTPIPAPPAVKVVVPPKEAAPAAPAGKPAAAPAANANADADAEDADNAVETPDDATATDTEETPATDARLPRMPPKETPPLRTLPPTTFKTAGPAGEASLNRHFASTAPPVFRGGAVSYPPERGRNTARRRASG